MPKLGKLKPARLRRILDANFEIVKERTSKEEITLICPETGCPDSTGNRSVNLKTNLTNCWRCGKGGHIIPFLVRNGVDVNDEDVDSLDQPLELEFEAESRPPTGHAISLPQGFTPVSEDPTGTYARLLGKMANRKHLYLEDFIEAGVGYTKTGVWEPFAIFPVYEMGRLVYYQGRTYGIADEGGRTKKFPSKVDVPFGARFWVYGFDQALATRPETIIVVESILNVLSLRWELKCQGITGVEPVAVFKHAISKVQLEKMLVLPCKEVCMMYDGDATESAWEEAAKLSDKRVATVAEMPVGIDANDDAKLAVKNFLKRKRYTPTNALRLE